MSNPDLLTKSQLKEELQAHGVEVPSGNVLKSVYVDLYNKHITKQMQGFSSDDMAMEASSSSKKNKRLANKENILLPPIQEQIDATDAVFDSDYPAVQAYVKPEKNNSSRRNRYNNRVPSYITGDHGAAFVAAGIQGDVERSRTSSTPVDISSLSQLTNEEIASKLKELGQAIGPVTRTTRQLYLNQLRKLLQSEGASGQGQYSDRDTDSEEAQPTVAVTRSSSRRRSSYQATEKPPIVTRKSASTGHRSVPSFSLRRSTSSTTRSVAARSEHETSDFSSTPSTLFSAPNSSRLFEKAQSLSPEVKQQHSSPITTPLNLRKKSSVTDNRYGSSSSLPSLSAPTKLQPPIPIAWGTMSEAGATNSCTTDSVSNGSDKHEDDFSSDQSSQPIHYSVNNTLVTGHRGTRSQNLLSSQRDSSYLLHSIRGSSKRSQQICASATKRRPLRGSMSAAGKEEQTQVEAKTSQRAKTPVKAKTVKSERRWIPIWIQGIVTALLVLFIYLVIQAMEANPKPPSLP